MRKKESKYTKSKNYLGLSEFQQTRATNNTNFCNYNGYFQSAVLEIAPATSANQLMSWCLLAKTACGHPQTE